MTTFLVIIAVVLAVLAISQLAKVFDISAKLSKDKSEVKASQNKANAMMFRIFGIVFFVSTVYLLIKYGSPMPESASEHGVEMDMLMKYNMYIIITVYFIVNGILFYFASKYYHKKDRKALFFAHDNRLELVWTVVPTMVLAFIIIFGLITWFDITGEPGEDTQFIEITSEQYTWTVRYPGADGEFGGQSYNLIGCENETGNPNTLGVITPFVVENKIKEIDEEIASINNSIENEAYLYSDGKIEAMEDKIYKLKRHKQRILELNNYSVGETKAWEASKDDKIVKELHLVVNQEYEFSFKSKDVIHSAYMPHFRTQMNTVPGTINKFKMTPTITTAEMKGRQGEDFEYVLLCNKICGGGHWNMKIPIIVESQEEYDTWMAEQAQFVQSDEPAEEDNNAEAESSETEESENAEEGVEEGVAQQVVVE